MASRHLGGASVGRSPRDRRAPYCPSTTALKNRMVGRAVPGEPRPFNRLPIAIQRHHPD